MKRVSLTMITLLWILALSLPLQRFQQYRWVIHGIQLPLYYLLIPIPTLLIILYAVVRVRPQNVWLWSWWLFPLVCLPGVLLGVDRIWAFRQWSSLWMRGLGLGASLAFLANSLSAQKILQWIYPVAIAACLLGITEMICNTNPLIDRWADPPHGSAITAPAVNTLFHTPSDFSGSARPRGTQGNRIPYCAILVPFVMISFWKLQSLSRWTFLHAAATASLILLILWSRSRSGWLGLVVGSLVYFPLSQRTSRHALAWILGAFVLALSVCWLMPTTRSSMINRTESFNMQDRDIQHRLGSLPVVHALHGHWLFGVGYGNYGKVYAPFYRGPFPFLDEPDNQYLRWLIENGIVGLVVLVVFIGHLMRRCWISARALTDTDHREFYTAVLAGWCAIAVTFFFFDGFYWLGPNVTFWCLLGVLSTVFMERVPDALSN